jgi:hypothetical protein
VGDAVNAIETAARELLRCWDEDDIEAEGAAREGLCAALEAPAVAPDAPPMCPVCGNARLMPCYYEDWSLSHWYCPWMIHGVACEFMAKPGDPLDAHPGQV